MSGIRWCRSRVAATTATVVAAAVLSAVPQGPALAVGDWGPVEDVGVDIDVYNYAREPVVVRVRTDRTAVAAWVAGDYETPGPVTVSLRAAGGGWTVAQAISPDLPGGATYALDLAGADLASVAWERRAGGSWRIEESHLDSGAWTAPVEVGRGRKPEVVVDGTGVTTLAWSNHGVRVARRSEDGTWSATKRIADGPVSGLELASNPAGDVAVAWTSGYRKVRASVRPHGPNPWAAPVTLGKGPFVTSWQVAMGGSGRALVVWTIGGIWNDAKHDYQNYLASARSDPQGRWSKPRVLTRRLGEDGGSAALSMNGQGRAVATWIQVQRSDSPAILWAARFRPDGTWSAPMRVSKVRWPEPRTWLDHKGVAHVVANRGGIWHFSQEPGAAWKVTELNQRRMLDAHGVGDRLVMLFHRSTLRSRTLDVP